MFGGGVPSERDSSEEQEVEREDGKYVGEYKVADAEDMDFLANLMG